MMGRSGEEEEEKEERERGESEGKTLIVCCTSWHLKIVLSIVWRLILAILIVYGELVNLTIVGACCFSFF